MILTALQFLRLLEDQVSPQYSSQEEHYESSDATASSDHKHHRIREKYWMDWEDLTANRTSCNDNLYKL